MKKIILILLFILIFNNATGEEKWEVIEGNNRIPVMEIYKIYGIYLFAEKLIVNIEEIEIYFDRSIERLNSQIREGIRLEEMEDIYADYLEFLRVFRGRINMYKNNINMLVVEREIRLKNWLFSLEQITGKKTNEEINIDMGIFGFVKIMPIEGIMMFQERRIYKKRADIVSGMFLRDILKERWVERYVLNTKRIFINIMENLEDDKLRIIELTRNNDELEIYENQNIRNIGILLYFVEEIMEKLYNFNTWYKEIKTN